MACYCANYYGSINCHNAVSKFGDRCALCMSTYSQSSSYSSAMQNGVPQANEHWVENSKREQLRREEEKNRRQRINRTASS